ncbi:MAG: hypothetical protein Q9200_002861 [Gallowayella weberi]
MAAIVIAESGDLTIEVVEFDHNIRGANKESIILKTGTFQVSRTILAESSEYFTRLLRNKNFKEANEDIVELQDDSVTSMQIWFQVLHRAKVTYDVGLFELWNLAAAGKKYCMDMTELSPWFATCYERQDIDRWYHDYLQEELRSTVPNPRLLLQPCYTFDHAKGFLRITKFCAYQDVGHIEKVRVTRHYDLDLPPRVIQQLNAARGRLRTIVSRGLYIPAKSLLKASCTCKEKTLFGYMKRLTDIDVWPFEEVAQKSSITTITNRLVKFSYEPHPTACGGCQKEYSKIVDDTRAKTNEYFDGLYLDCLDDSKPKTGDSDSDYWNHNDLDEDAIIYGCRVEHRQPTWYFSFMGRREARDEFLRKKRSARKRDRQEYEGSSDE